MSGYVQVEVWLHEYKLLREMDVYCLEQTEMSLKDYSAQLMAEEITLPSAPSI